MGLRWMNRGWLEGFMRVGCFWGVYEGLED